jgi:hypothetical protein
MMNNAVIKRINLGGIKFGCGLPRLCEREKGYKLKLEVVSPQKTVETSVKVVIIGTEKVSDANFVYRAMYRDLTYAQIDKLNEIINSFDSGVFDNSGMLTASVVK